MRELRNPSPMALCRCNRNHLWMTSTFERRARRAVELRLGLEVRPESAEALDLSVSRSPKPRDPTVPSREPYIEATTCLNPEPPYDAGRTPSGKRLSAPICSKPKPYVLGGTECIFFFAGGGGGGGAFKSAKPWDPTA